MSDPLSRPSKEEILRLLGTADPKEISRLFERADTVRRETMGDGIFLRGIIEFSNICDRACSYCGINRDNISVKRYSLTTDEIMSSVKMISSCGIRTVVLQSGESDLLDPEWLAELVKRIKSEYDMAVTLSAGEKSPDEYRMWKKAGADRYLLKIETSNRELYSSLHPGMSFDNRVKCLDTLKELGYQTGSGNLIGLKGQTLEDIASDILFFKNREFEMIGIGPFIPHGDTPLSCEAHGDPQLVLKTLALTRIMVGKVHLPGTTALGSLDKDYRLEGLKCGANVLMPNFTPQTYKKLYEIYPGKRCVDEPAGACSYCMDGMAKLTGRYIDPGRGDLFRQV